MTNLVRGNYGPYSFDLIYENERLSSINGTHTCFSGRGSGTLSLHRFGSYESVFLACGTCYSSMHLGNEINNLPPPGKYQDDVYLTHACVKCGTAMTFHELLDAEHNLCAKCKTPATPAGYVKVTFNLAAELYLTLKTLAENRGVTMTETLNQAIATEKYIDEHEQKGCQVLLEHPNGRFEQLSFRQKK